jgi:nucleoside-diphosphate-sugar epimerase
VSMHLTPLLLAKSWNVTSVVRNPDHKDDILKLGQGHPGKIDVLVASLEDIKSDEDSQKVLDKVQPDYVVWSAGARGIGGPSRTYAVDQDAAKHYISSSLSTPSVTKFLMVSYIASRKARPPWWTDEDWNSAQHLNSDVLPHYFKAKVEADEHLAAAAKKRLDSGDSVFQAISLRPGYLMDSKATGRVNLGKTSSRGNVSREDVALVAAALLERSDTRGWFDLLEGDVDIATAIDRLVQDGHNGMEGEDMERIYARAI